MTRQRIGEALAGRLYAAELAIDQALAEIAALTATLPAARVEARISATCGQGAFEGVVAALTALVEARGHLGQTHRTLGAVARSLGLAALAAGPVDKPGDRPPIGGLTPHDEQLDYPVNKPLPYTPYPC